MIKENITKIAAVSGMIMTRKLALEFVKQTKLE